MPFDHSQDLSFLWLELTNRCNLECTHCYAGSSPTATDESPLGLTDYREILTSASQHGCRAVQFIGGEPTLNKMLPRLIEMASLKGFDYIEVFSNLVSVSEEQLRHYKCHGVQLATSVYGPTAEVHDAITTRKGSFERTLENLRKVVAADIPIRASVIRMETNIDTIDETAALLNSIGVEKIGFDDARAFGRAQGSKSCDMGELCGECAGGTICVDPNGKVSPCIMSRAWGVGEVREDGFDELVQSQNLRSIRAQIAKSVEQRMGGCNPSSQHPCGPDSGGSCNPCSPTGNCGPNACGPK